MVKLKDFPEEGELVVGTVKSVKNYGAFISLDEYEDKEGFIHIREVATGWIKYVRNHISEGQRVVCKVLGVKEDKGHIDLSLKAVNEHQKREIIQQWKNEQKAEKLIELLGQGLGSSKEDMLEIFRGSVMETFDTLYGAFEECSINPEYFRENFKGDWVEPFIKLAGENITPPYVVIKGVLTLSTTSPNGVEDVKKALKMVESAGDEAEIKVQYIAAPKYGVVVTAPDYKVAESELKTAAEKGMEFIRKKGGEAVFTRNR